MLSIRGKFSGLRSRFSFPGWGRRASGGGASSVAREVMLNGESADAPVSRLDASLGHRAGGGSSGGAGSRESERGWAMLGMIMALTVMSIMLVGIVPQVQLDVKRSKEEEMIYRGELVAEGIARYYNGGRSLGAIQLSVPPPYGYLYDLKKLGEGAQIGVVQLKFVRPSAMKDPMVNKDWVPVRARDPRLMNVLQQYAAFNLVTIPQSYMILAAPPMKIQTITQPDGSQSGQGTQTGAAGFGSGATPSSGSGTVTGQPLTGNGQTGQAIKPGANSAQSDDDDDDDDDANGKLNDPLSHLLKDTEHGLPIVGVAPNLKGPSVHSLWGMKNYEEWIFIYVPPQPQLTVGSPALQPSPQPGATPGRPGSGGVGANPTQINH
jgi:hypothetical protein